MKRLPTLLLCLTCTLAVAFPALGAVDAQGSKDHPRVSRFKGAVISSYKASDFGQTEVLLAIPRKKQSKKVEGKLTTIIYDIPVGHDSHEVYRSYQRELDKSGFTILFGCAGPEECGASDMPTHFEPLYGYMGNTRPDSIRYLAAQRHSPQGDIYVTLYAYFQPRTDTSDKNRAILNVVEVAPLNEGLVTVTAEGLARDIAGEGRAIVHGVYFDTDSGALKSESDPALTEMAKLLKERSDLKVYIVGHTDNAGQPAHNLELSQSRAASVVKALVSRYKIDGKRLEAKGVGSLAPVASNHSEAGRSKNRRVELVER